MTNYTNYSNVAVDGIISSSSQGLMMGTVMTMPTATAAMNGCVVYYIGASTGTYLQNTWYRCKESDTPGIYEWEWLDIGGSGGTYRNMMTQVTLSASSWSENTQTVTVNGLRTTDIVVSSPVPSQVGTYQYCGIVQTANATNSITFTCDTVPSTDITVNVAMIATIPSGGPEIIVDSIPTQGSTNPVQSGGVYSALSGKQDTLTFDNSPTSGSDNPVKSGGVYTALGDKFDTASMITTSGSGASAGITSADPIAMKGWVNSSISTNTATFRGTFSVEGTGTYDLGLTITYDPSTGAVTGPSNSDIATTLASKMTTLSITPTNNDYVFVSWDYSADSGNIDKYDRFKYTDGTPGAWGYEFTLNNSSFTADQWAAINSGINTTKVGVYDGYANTIAGKQSQLQVTIDSTATDISTTVDDAPNSSNTTHLVTSAGVYSAINSVLPTIGSGDAGKVLAVNAGEDGYEYINNTEIKSIANRTELINWIKNGAKVGNILSFSQYSNGWSEGLLDAVLSVTSKSSTETRFSGQCRYKNSSGDYFVVSLRYVHSSDTFIVEYRSSVSGNTTVNDYVPPGTTFSGCTVR